MPRGCPALTAAQPYFFNDQIRHPVFSGTQVLFGVVSTGSAVQIFPYPLSKGGTELGGEIHLADSQPYRLAYHLIRNTRGPVKDKGDGGIFPDFFKPFKIEMRLPFVKAVSGPNGNGEAVDTGR